jgi:hypothetical protein
METHAAWALIERTTVKNNIVQVPARRKKGRGWIIPIEVSLNLSPLKFRGSIPDVLSSPSPLSLANGRSTSYQDELWSLLNGTGVLETVFRSVNERVRTMGWKMELRSFKSLTPHRRAFKILSPKFTTGR